jgi:hypothetical protein
VADRAAGRAAAVSPQHARPLTGVAVMTAVCGTVRLGLLRASARPDCPAIPCPTEATWVRAAVPYNEVADRPSGRSSPS